MISDAFSLGGLLMFVLGVLLSGWVMSATSGLRAKAAGGS